MADVRFQHVYKRYGDNPPVIVDLNLQVAIANFWCWWGHRAVASQPRCA